MNKTFFPSFTVAASGFSVLAIDTAVVVVAPDGEEFEFLNVEIDDVNFENLMAILNVENVDENDFAEEIAGCAREV